MRKREREIRKLQRKKMTKTYERKQKKKQKKKRTNIQGKQAGHAMREQLST